MLIGFPKEAQSLDKMQFCKDEIKKTCKGIPFRECIKTKKFSPGCAEVFDSLHGYLEKTKDICREIPVFCKVEKATKGGPSIVERADKFKKCIAKNRSKFSSDCKSFMKKMSSQAQTNDFQSKLKYD